MYDSLSTRDNAISQPEFAPDGSIRLLDETVNAASSGNLSDGVQATQQLVGAGQVPALEIVSSPASEFSSARESFDAMISTDGLTVFNRPGRGHSDYFGEVDGMDDQGFLWDGRDGAITKSGIDSFIAEADAAPRGRFVNPVKDSYVDALRQLSENWDSPEMAPYKDTQDSMTRESFAAGLESLPLRQEQAAIAAELPLESTPEVASTEQSEAAPVDGPVNGPVDMPASVAVDTATEVLVEIPAEIPAEVPAEIPTDTPADTPVDGPVDMPAEAPAATMALSEETTELSLVRAGEGPYQVAERLLSSGDSATSHQEVMALVRAIQAQYREENPEDPNMASLKVNHQFISPENLDSLLNSISEPAMRDSIAAKLLTPAVEGSEMASPEVSTEVSEEISTEESADVSTEVSTEVSDAITEQEADPADSPLVVLSEAAAELSQVRRGEGPYQVAARILASGGGTASNSEVTALTRAMQAQYRQENPDDANMVGLRQGHQFLTAESVASILENISDPALRASIEAKLIQ